MLGCSVLVCTHKESKMQKLASLVCLSLLVCCIGFLIKAEAADAAELITGQKLVYSTVTHSMFLMLLFILQYCRFSIPTILEFVFHGINLFITCMVITLDHHHLFYKSYWAVDNGGYVILEKEYGPIHTIAVLLFALYMITALIVAIIFSIKNIRERSRYVWRLMIAVLLPCISYVIPKITGINNDFQPIAFAAFTVMIIIMVYRDNIYDVQNISMQFITKSMKDALIVFDNHYSFKGCNDKAFELFPELKTVVLDSDIRKGSTNLTTILNNKITEFEKENSVFSISIRPIRDRNETIGKVVWMSDVTVEKNYLTLLEKQKNKLQNEVDELSELSITDEMTGLENRRGYDIQLRELNRKKILSGYSFLVFDLNGLKHVNDTIGHSAGDVLIKNAAGLLKDLYGNYGNLYRTGGDEFVLIVSGYKENPNNLIDMLESKLDEYNQSNEIKLSIAYGLANSDEYNEKASELVRIADKKMYECKRAFYLKNGLEMR